MFIAHFEIDRDEPEIMYFTSGERELLEFEFKGKKRQPIELEICKDFSLNFNKKKENKYGK